jgi:hypothetical protein
MSATTDLDRVLGEWLNEGPTRAPDHPVDAAIEHARSHPRRRDPLAFLRPDPMAPRSLGIGARPVMVLAVLGLLLAAVVAVGVGSNRDPAVVGPSPSMSASQPPPASPSPSTAASPLVIELLADPTEANVTIVDASGTLAGARAPGSDEPSPDPSAEMPDSGILVQNQDPTTLRVTWIGGPCEREYDLGIDRSGTAIAVTVPDCQGDALAIGRVVLLEFAEPVDAASITATLVE